MRTRSASAAAAFLASFSAFLARPDSFFAFPPFGGIAMCSDLREFGRRDGRGDETSGTRSTHPPGRGLADDRVMLRNLILEPI